MTAAAIPHMPVFGTASSGTPALRLVGAPSVSSSAPLYMELAVPIARSHAFRLLRSRSIRADEFDDVVQELLAEAVARWPRFDDRRAGAGTFISLVMSHKANAMLRARHATKRGSKRCFSVGDEDLLDQGAAPHGGDHRANQLDRAVARQVLREAIVDLPPHLQRLCGLLAKEGIATAARALGLPRHIVRAQVGEIRRRLISAGIERGDG